MLLSVKKRKLTISRKIKYYLTFFVIYGLTCIELARKRQVKRVELFDAKIRHDFDGSNNIKSKVTCKLIAL